MQSRGEQTIPRRRLPPLRETVKNMARRPASVTQADIARAVRAAKQAGATEVEVRVGNERIIIRINPASDAESSLEKSHKIVL